MQYDQIETTVKFYKEFSERVHDTVQSLEMVSLEAEPETFKELNLVLTSPRRELWGLFVFCEHGLYFYIHPYESAMAMIYRQAVHGKEPIEQLLAIHELDSVSFSLNKHKWYELFFSSSSGGLLMEFKDKSGKTHCVVITSQNKAVKVLEKINLILGK